MIRNIIDRIANREDIFVSLPTLKTPQECLEEIKKRRGWFVVYPEFWDTQDWKHGPGRSYTIKGRAILDRMAKEAIDVIGTTPEDAVDAIVDHMQEIGKEPYHVVEVRAIAVGLPIQMSRLEALGCFPTKMLDPKSVTTDI